MEEAKGPPPSERGRINGKAKDKDMRWWRNELRSRSPAKELEPGSGNDKAQPRAGSELPLVAENAEVLPHKYSEWEP